MPPASYMWVTNIDGGPDTWLLLLTLLVVDDDKGSVDFEIIPTPVAADGGLVPLVPPTAGSWCITSLSCRKYAEHTVSVYN